MKEKLKLSPVDVLWAVQTLNGVCCDLIACEEALLFVNTERPPACKPPERHQASDLTSQFDAAQAPASRFYFYFSGTVKRSEDKCVGGWSAAIREEMVVLVCVKAEWAEWTAVSTARCQEFFWKHIQTCRLFREQLFAVVCVHGSSFCSLNHN